MRAITFMKEKVIDGMSIEAIADRHNTSRRTVSRVLTWAERANIFADIEDQILQEVAPMAVDAIKHALSQNDAQVGLEILKGLNIIKKTHAVTAKEVKEQSDLVAYIAKSRDKAEIDANTVDGQTIDSTPEPLQLVANLPNDE